MSLVAQSHCLTTSKFLASLWSLDSYLSLDKHISFIRKSAYYHIRSLHYISSTIADDMAKSVASSLVCCRIDYTKSLLFTITQKNINRLQRVQNTFARVVASHAVPRDTHSSGILKYLHWLPIEQHMRFTHNTLCSTQPAYRHSLLNYHTPTRGLRFANTNLLSAPRVRTTFASRGFSVAAPAVWNSLSSGIRDAFSAHTFCCRLKTHCFQQAFGSP